MILPRVGALGNAVIDAVIFCPFVYFPIYYVFREFAYSNMEARAQPLKVIKSGLKTWDENIHRDAKACAMFWIPANTFNFWAVPLHLRQPFIGGVGFVWAMILSKTTGRRNKEQRQ